MRTNPIPDITLERYLLDQLPPDQCKRVHAALQGEPQLRHHLQYLQQENLRLLEQYPVDDYREPILRQVMGDRPETSHRKVSWFAWWSATGAVMAMLLVVVGFWLIPSRSPSPPGPGRPKGAMPSPIDCQFHLFSQQDRYLQPLSDGARVKPGARLQLAYSARLPYHGVMLSYDSRRQIVLHFPESLDGATLLNQGRQMPLPHSYELDRVADFERFVFITSPKEISVNKVLQRIKEMIDSATQPATAPLAFPAPLQVQTMLVHKERQP